MESWLVVDVPWSIDVSLGRSEDPTEKHSRKLDIRSANIGVAPARSKLAENDHPRINEGLYVYYTARTFGKSFDF